MAIVTTSDSEYW